LSSKPATFNLPEEEYVAGVPPLGLSLPVSAEVTPALCNDCSIGCSTAG